MRSLDSTFQPGFEIAVKASKLLPAQIEVCPEIRNAVDESRISEKKMRQHEMNAPNGGFLACP